ncbi:MAG: glycosyltransferase family 2 protein [Microcoleaceae cyanobacterium]
MTNSNLQPSGVLVSILIINYNYGRFLGDAINSALNQTYYHTEVIVVDDGSTDDSRAVIEAYGDQIVPVFQENGGQASAFNAGWRAAKGEIICFLDSDDTFYPDKVKRCVDLIERYRADHPLILVSHSMDIIDQAGNFSGHIRKTQLSQYSAYTGFYDFAQKYRYVPFVTSPTSGNVITQSLAERIFPIPEVGVKTSADDFVIKASLMLGKVLNVDDSLGKYRIHGQNYWANGLRKAKTKDFMLLQERFLNEKLVENHLEPVISYLDSMGAAPYHKMYGSELSYLKLGLKVLLNRPDSRTFRFFKKSFKVTLKNLVKKLVGIKNPSL